MRIALAADHYGFPMKLALSAWLQAQGHDILDAGPTVYEPDDLLIDRADAACKLVVEDKADRAILLCKSGSMMQIRANRWAGIRAALGMKASLIHHDREASDINILCLAAHSTSQAKAEELVTVFLDTPFEPLERRLARLAKLEEPTDI